MAEEKLRHHLATTSLKPKCLSIRFLPYFFLPLVLATIAMPPNALGTASLDHRQPDIARSLIICFRADAGGNSPHRSYFHPLAHAYHRSFLSSA